MGDYLYFKNSNKTVSKKIDKLVQESLREPFDGIGKPEKLREILVATGQDASHKSIDWFTNMKMKR